VLTIAVTSVFVDDQEKALAFYTDVLGFVKKRDLPVGEARWLTVVSPAAPDGVELLLEPNDNPISRTYQQAVHQAGIPATTFPTDVIHKEYQGLTELGVSFTGEPAQMGAVTSAVSTTPAAA
jgi:catechol 2,3-dioxygenase-like lactoylglutathione lyase family enzyme